MKIKALEAIKKYSLIQEKDNICIALSGGADSVALIHFLHENSISLGIDKIYACHLNHRLRGEESIRDFNFVKELCNEMGIKLISKEVDINSVAKEKGLSIELCAREERYSLFESISLEYCCKIATAHTLSDCIETTIFNMARGSGVKGLSGIPPKRDYLIRPLITATREDVENYIEENQLNYVTDSTNLTDVYTRNKIRHNIVPKLYEINQNIDKSFLRLFSQLKDIGDYIDFASKIEIDKLKSPYGYKREEFLSLHSCLKSEIIAKLLRGENISPSAEKIDNILSIIENRGTLELKKDVFFVCRDNLFDIIFKKEDAQINFSDIYDVLNKEKLAYITLNNKKYKFIITPYEQIENFKENNNLDLIFCVDYDKMDRNAIIRNKIDGDKIKLEKSVNKVKLKKLYNEYKIPVYVRDKLIVISQQNNIVWAEQIGSSQSFKATDNTKQILAIFAEDNL